ncbi:MAG: hypothetical protein ACE5E1_09380, partial [Phycisphaerae bacterium]
SFFDVSGGTFTDATWPWPNPSRFEDTFYSVSDAVLDYFRRDQTFERRHQEAHPAARRLVDGAHFARCLRYAKETRWGRMPAAFRPDPEDASFDLRWYFEQFLPQRVPHSEVARVEALTTVVRFLIEGAEDEEWFCRFDHGRLVEVHRGPNGLRDAFGYRIRRDRFREIVAGRRTVQSVFYQGEADLLGDPLRAMKMVPVIEAFLRECPVRAPVGDESP